MKRYSIVALVLFLIFIVVANKTHAIGGFITNGIPQIAPVETKMIIILDGTKETIVASDTFAVNPLIITNFAWVVPLPSKPTIAMLRDDVFIQMDKLTQKKFAKDSWWKKVIYADIVEETSAPSQLFSYTAYLKNPVTFSSNDRGTLFQKWLSSFGYALPKNSWEMYRQYLNKKWYFGGIEVDAVHMEFDATDSLRMSGAHLVPALFTFHTTKPFIPLKFTMVQPDRDSVAAPLSFPYGSSSEAVLGAKDQRFDDLLSKPSVNKYPPLPLDLLNQKVELFIFDKHRTTLKGFTTIYADTVSTDTFSFNDPKGRQYFTFPSKHMYLTHLYAYKPISQMDDFEIQNASSNARVNPNVGFVETIMRVILCILLLLGLLKGIKRRFII